MTDVARDLHDEELDAAADAALGMREQAEFVRGCTVTASKCALIVYELIDKHFEGYSNRLTAALLHEAAGRMIRMGDTP